MTAYTVGSLFSGIGGIDLAAQWAGFETAWFVEKEPYCQKVLARHWPGVAIHDDVFECRDLPHVDVIAGGFPCQPFSVAGLRRGAADERFLLPEMLRIVSEVKPYVVLFENVPGFPSLNDGAEFKHLLRALANMGFDAQWGHLRASDVGAPHRRERWFCVAYCNSSGYTKSANQQRSPDGQWNIQAYKCEGEQVGIAVDCKRIGLRSASVGDTTSAGLEGCHGQEPAHSEHSRHGSRATQSRLGGNAHGVSGGMDEHRWPARPGQPQHDYEPPRVTHQKANRAARLKALGNAVVPQVVYPAFVAIREWLEGQR